MQSLWSDYGEIARYYSPKNKLNFIVKVINLHKVDKHPRGFNTEFAHQRKLSSYQNEIQFYQHFSCLCDDNCRVPKYYFHTSNKQQIVLAMEDLNQAGFSIRKLGIGVKNGTNERIEVIEKVLKWLAYFHMRFMQEDISVCWPEGSYWHLATRPSEYKKMHDSALKKYALKISEHLKNARFQCLVHGDAKLANFCFNEDTGSNKIAAVDFQYTGRGAGIKDVAYLLGSCLDNENLKQYAEGLLEIYFEHARKAAYHHKLKVDMDAFEAEYRVLYKFAWADFERFLAGWAPQHYKLTEYSSQLTQAAIQALQN